MFEREDFYKKGNYKATAGNIFTFKLIIKQTLTTISTQAVVRGKRKH